MSHDTTPKHFSTLRAQLALRGYTLHRTDPRDGEVRFVVGRWSMVRELRDLPAVEAFAKQVGAAS